MSDKQDKQPSDADAELQREIRAGRKFTLSEAIGRMAGPGAMKGVSPISRKKQVVAEIEEFLRSHLSDTSGALRVVLLRRINATEALLSNYDHPLQFLAECVRRVLGSEYLLTDIVREADIEWGQTFGERPFFEREGCAPHPDDPYTLDSVRHNLAELLKTIDPVQ